MFEQLSQKPRTSQVQLGLAIGCSLALALSLVSPLYPKEQWLQHVPTIVGLVFLFDFSRRGYLSSCSMTCIALFLLLHIIGARWIYSYVPYDRWCDAVFGVNPSEKFGWQRNHYDRLVHFAFGVLMTLPLAEAITKQLGLNRWLALYAAFTFVMGVSAAYEVLEWLLAVIAAPEFAERYNGQQGDYWDPQKDIALAGLGSLLTTAVIGLARSACFTQTSSLKND